MTEPETRRLRTAEDVLLALRDPDLGVWVALLQAVLENPAAALQFGPFQGVDLVDELITQTFRVDVPMYRQVLTHVLSKLQDPRVPHHFRRLLTYYGDPEVLQIVKERLMEEPVEGSEDAYRAMAMQIDSPGHTQAAADLLTRAETLEPCLAIRVSVANGLGIDRSPAVDPDTVEHWVAELSGPYLREATLLIEGKGQVGLPFLTERWNDLPTLGQTWLIRWATTNWPLESVDVLKKGLASEDSAVVLEALRAVSGLGAPGALFEPLVTPHAESPDAAIRRAAIAAGARVGDVRKALVEEEEAEPIVELLIRLRIAEGVAAIPILVEHLEHGDYRVRVQAQTELSALGEAVEETAKRFVLGDNDALRAAGANLLLGLGQQEWLETHLLG